MKYRAVEVTGDSIGVPQVVFQKLTSVGAKDDGRFRVALFVLANGECEIEEIARALALSAQKVKSAIDFWEGAGLLCPAQQATQTEMLPYARKRMTTREVVSLSTQDKTPAMLMSEIQRLFGGVVSQSDMNIFMTLYGVDKVPPEVILMAAGFCAERGKTSARYIEKLLLTWRREGVLDAKDADAHLKLLSAREKQEAEYAALFGLPAAALSFSERKKINAWAEEFGYGREMVETARLVAGEHANEIKYVDKILKRWCGKGYQTPRDVQMAENTGNIRVQGPVQMSGSDLLGENMDYVPMKGKGSAE